MSFINSNNFCRWGDVIHENPYMSGGATLDDWTTDDDAPIGDNESDWGLIGGYAAVINGATESTRGLSQSVKIKKGERHIIEFTIKENLYGDTDFYIYFIGGEKKQLAATERIGAVGDTTFYYEVIANADYDKILACAVAVAGAGISAYIKVLRIVSIGACKYAPPLVKGDVLSIYANIATDLDGAASVNLRLGLWKIDEGIYLNNIEVVSTTGAGAPNYDFYFNWTVPILPEGSYCFFLWDNSTSKNIYFSNMFSYQKSIGYTSFIEYRNDVSALGFQYSDITSLYNKLRIDLRTGDPGYNENVKGYKTYEGDLIRTKSDIQKTIEFNTRFFDEGAHEAFFSMLAHSTILIDSVQYKKTQEGGYEIAWTDFDDNRIANGVVNLLEVDYSEAVKTC